MTGFAMPLLLLLLPLPLLAALLLPPARASGGGLAVPQAIALRLRSGEALADRIGRVRRGLAWAAWILLVVALAGPQRILPAAALPASAREIILVLDLSGSMERTDFLLDGRTVRRLEAVKAIAGAFVRARAGDRIGLVFFAEQAEVAAVPTFDVAAVETVLTEATIGLLGRSTAIGDGLGLAVKRLKDSPTPSRVVILLSDGTSTAGKVGPQAAAELARHFGIRVHTIALGTDEELSGSSGGVSSLVDTEALRLVAETAGGESFRVRTTEDLAAVTTAIDRLEGGETDAPSAAVADGLWPWPAAASLGLMLVLVFGERRRP